VLSDVYYYLTGSTFSTPVDYYYSSTIGDASNLSSGDILYTDAALTTPLGTHSGYGSNIKYLQDGAATTTTICGTGSTGEINISTNNTGVIQRVNCGPV
jgi:hypothetical protein